jgi:hypothetical protein
LKQQTPTNRQSNYFVLVFDLFKMSQTQHEYCFGNEDNGDDDRLQCYAIDQKRTTILTMGVGRNWWNYIIEFKFDGTQHKVFIENKDGIIEQENKRIIRYWNVSMAERVKPVDKAYECKDGEIFITWASDNIINLTYTPIQ